MSKLTRTVRHAVSEAAYYRLKLEQVMARLESVVTPYDASKLIVWIQRELSEPPALVGANFALEYRRMKEAVEEKRVEVAAELIKKIDDNDLLEHWRAEWGSRFKR